MADVGQGGDPDFGARPRNGDEPRVVVRDRRRIDPVTGQVRPPAPEPEPGESGGRHAAAAPAPDAPAAPEDVVEPDVDDGGLHELQSQLDERTADLQRLTAEYANYRKRVDRDREAVLVHAKASLAGELLSVLDDVDRAAAHGDLTGGFKTVADKLAETLRRAGLEPFGEPGEPFDPSVHEAVQHDTSPDVDGPTVSAVLRRGYRFGDRVMRAALVAVTDHESGAPGGFDAPGFDDGAAEPAEADPVASEGADGAPRH